MRERSMLPKDANNSIEQLVKVLTYAQRCDTETLADLQAWLDAFGQWAAEASRREGGRVANAAAAVIEKIIMRQLSSEHGMTVDCYSADELAQLMEKMMPVGTRSRTEDSNCPESNRACQCSPEKRRKAIMIGDRVPGG